MEINHINGTGVDTDKLSDVDAILMEESAKLHKLFSKYDRQLTLIGEMKSTEGTSSEDGCSFFHIAKSDDDELTIQKRFDRFVKRMDRFIRKFTHGSLFIAQYPPTEK